MVALAVACAGLGRAARCRCSRPPARWPPGSSGSPPSRPRFRLWLSFQTPAGLARMSPPAIVVGLLGALAVVWLVVRVLASRRPLRYADTWGCGRMGQTPRMEYTATAFAEPLRRIFSAVYRPTEDVTVDSPSGVALLRAVHRLSRQHPAVVRALSLRAGAGLGAALGGGARSRCSRARCTPTWPTWWWPSCCCSACSWRRARRERAGRVRARARAGGALPGPGAGAHRADPVAEGAHAEPARGAACGSRTLELRQALRQGSGRLHERLVALPPGALRGLRQHARGDRAPAHPGGAAAARRGRRSPGRRVPAAARDVLPGPGRARPGLAVRRHGLEPRDDGGRARRAHHRDGDLRPGAGRGLDQPRPDRGARHGAPRRGGQPRPPPGLRRALHRDAGRDRAAAGGQPGHAPRADDDPRGDGARVLGPLPGPDRMGGRAEAADLLLAAREPVRAVGRDREPGAGRPARWPR